MHSNRKAPWMLCLALLLVWPLTARAERPCRQIPSIIVEGNARLSVIPDRAELQVGVVTRDLKAAEAARQNAIMSQKLVSALKSKLGPQERLETAYYEVSPIRRWDSANKRYIREGYRCTNMMRLLLHDIKSVGRFLDLARQNGANRINGPYWYLADASAQKRKVQVMALKDAMAQARDLAKAAGVKLGAPLSINTTGITEPRRFMAKARVAPAPAGNQATPVAPARIHLSAEVRCVFMLLTNP